MIDIKPNTALSAQIVCTQTRSTLERVWVEYSLNNGHKLLVTGPINGLRGYTVNIFGKDNKCIRLALRVGPTQLLSYLEFAAEDTK